MTNNSKIYSDKIKLDKFYTKPSVARDCISQLDLTDYDCVIEPSAGNGSFFNQIKHKNIIGLDLMPENDSIKQQDWFEYQIDTKHKNVLVIGNPPFGLRNSLSKSFIKHATTFENVKTIAFILPDVYKKHTLQKTIPKDFRIKAIYELPKESFEIDGESYHVPCSFFIFERSEGKCLRFNPELYKESYDFIFGNKNDYDFFILGAAPSNIIDIPSSTNRGYYIKVKDGFSVDSVKDNFRQIKWKGFSSVNGGVSWLTKAEIVKTYIENAQTMQLNNISGLYAA